MILQVGWSYFRWTCMGGDKITMRNGNADIHAQTIEEESQVNAKTWAQTIEEGNAVLPQLGSIPSWEPSEEHPGHYIMPCKK